MLVIKHVQLLSAALRLLQLLVGRIDIEVNDAEANFSFVLQEAMLELHQQRQPQPHQELLLRQLPHRREEQLPLQLLPALLEAQPQLLLQLQPQEVEELLLLLLRQLLQVQYHMTLASPHRCAIDPHNINNKSRNTENKCCTEQGGSRYATCTCTNMVCCIFMLSPTSVPHVVKAVMSSSTERECHLASEFRLSSPHSSLLMITSCTYIYANAACTVLAAAPACSMAVTCSICTQGCHTSNHRLVELCMAGCSDELTGPLAEPVHSA